MKRRVTPETRGIPRARAIGAVVLAFLLGNSVALAGDAPAVKDAQTVVRWSELEVERGRLDRFAALAHENMRQTRRAEPGVLAFYAAAEKDQPHRIRVLEVYAGQGAYQTHLQTAHFKAFRAATSQHLTDRKLFDALPVALGAKPGLPPAGAVVRIAELEIDPARLDAYTAAVTEEIDASIRVEPGVFAIYAVALKERPNQLRFFEIYADEQAYLFHRETPHFRKYIEVTRSMITARRLIETVALPGAAAK